MSDIQREIKNTLSAHLKAYTEGDNEKAERLDKVLEENSIDWLTYQQSIISKQASKIMVLTKDIDMLEVTVNQQAEEISERDQTIANIQREFEQTDWGKENIELRERFNYWRELAGTRDNKIRDQAEEIERLRQALDMIEIHNGTIDAFKEIEKILNGVNPHVNP